jgi:hypothetical protein
MNADECSIDPELLRRLRQLDRLDQRTFVVIVLDQCARCQ